MKNYNHQKTLNLNKIYLIALVLLGAHQTVIAQSTLDSVLMVIESSNKVIASNAQYWEAQKLQYKTGLMPYNPKVDFDYLIGSPANAGNQVDFTVTQAIDFPTAYSKKKQLSNEQGVQVDYQLLATRQEILLEAKQICIELIYRNKYQIEIDKRLISTNNWLNNFQARLNKGEGSILDVNKAKLRWIETKNEAQNNLVAINQLNQKLIELNGGNKINFTDTTYPIIEIIPEFEALESAIEENDPILKYLAQEKVIGQKQIEVSKAMGLPKLETGYHYQSLLSQKFHGLHVGATIPLWENKNKTKTQKANLVYADFNLQSHLNEHYYTILTEYERLKNLEITLKTYQEILPTIKSIDLLDKSLSYGEISVIEYFMEMSFYNDAVTAYLKVEMEFQSSLARLYQYQL